MRYAVHSTVEKIEERTRNVWVGGTGPDAKFEKESLGWFVHIRGSREALYIGEVQPDPIDLNAGDRVRIVIEKLTTT